MAGTIDNGGDETVPLFVQPEDIAADYIFGFPDDEMIPDTIRQGVFPGQNGILNATRILNRRLDLIIGKVEFFILPGEFPGLLLDLYIQVLDHVVEIIEHMIEFLAQHSQFIVSDQVAAELGLSLAYSVGHGGKVLDGS